MEEIERNFEDDFDEQSDYSGKNRKVITQSSDPSVGSLLSKFTNGDLTVQPEFQREYVWDAKKASRLIESALLGIPLPIVYLSEESDAKEHVIDGQQRLTSLFSFIIGKLPDGKDFKLSGLEVFPELNGKTYKELDKAYQQKISYFPIRTVLFQEGSDPDLKFEIFKRLNTGSVPLNDQELRNCIYRGSYNDLVHELVREPDFRFLLGNDEPNKRRKDAELILRFFAFQNWTYLKYKPPMKSFLNKDAEKYRSAPADLLDDLRQKFKTAVHLSRTVFGQHAFKRFRPGGSARSADGHWEPNKFNASLFDVVMFMFADADKNLVVRNADAIREALIELMSANTEFIAAIELSTSSVQAVQKRFDLWRHEFSKIVKAGDSERRLFTLAEKKQLFDANPVCGICGNHIRDLDDAAVDHVQQFSQGGPTTLENGRLTHRYCNWSRSRTE